MNEGANKIQRFWKQPFGEAVDGEKLIRELYFAGNKVTLEAANIRNALRARERLSASMHL
jgi:hypothetical protein